MHFEYTFAATILISNQFEILPRWDISCFRMQFCGNYFDFDLLRDPPKMGVLRALWMHFCGDYFDFELVLDPPKMGVLGTL